MMVDNDQIMKMMPRATSREPFGYYVAEFFSKRGGREVPLYSVSYFLANDSSRGGEGEIPP